MRVRRANVILLSCVALGVCAPPGRAQGPTSAPCPGGRYLTANALVAADSSVPVQSVIIGPEISIGTICDPVRARLKATARGTAVRAVWRSCAGLRGKVKLKGNLDTTCTNLAGTLIARRSRLRVPFVAEVSRCGDGVVDPANGEQCDRGPCPGGVPCSAACTCPIPTTTTTTTSTSSSITSSTLRRHRHHHRTTMSTTTSTTATTTRGTATTTTSTTSTSSSTVVTTTTTTTTSSTTTTMPGCVPGETQRPFSVTFAVPDSSVIVQGLTLLIDYPEMQVTIPGSGAALTVRQSLSNVQAGALSSPFDLDMALREQIAGTASPLVPGALFTINFLDCVGATPPTAADFACTVEAASDPLGQPDQGVTCTVSSP